MLMSIAVMVAFLASLLLPVAGVAAVVTYVRRTRHLERTKGDGSANAMILDSLGRIHIRLDAMATRLHRIEERANALPATGQTHLQEP